MDQLWLSPQGEISRSLRLRMTVWNGSAIQALAPRFPGPKVSLHRQSKQGMFSCWPTGVNGLWAGTGEGWRLRKEGWGQSMLREDREGAESEQNIVAAVLSSCCTILLHPSSLHSRQRNNCVLKRLGLRDTVNFLTDTSLVNVYKFPWITCHLENYRLWVRG